MRLRLRSIWPAGVALAGMVAGHWLGYRLAVPGGHRLQVLDATGHGRWDVIVALAVFGGAVGLTLLLGRAFRDGAAGRPLNEAPFAQLMLRLTAIQASLFVVMELLERAFSHAGLSASVLVSRPFVVGLVVQALVAALVACAVSALARAAAAVGRSLRPADSYPSISLRLPVARPDWRPVRLLASATGVRGPPTR